MTQLEPGEREDGAGLPAGISKTAYEIVKKFGSPLVFRAKGIYTRQRQYIAEGSARALVWRFALGPQLRLPSPIYLPLVGAVLRGGADVGWCCWGGVKIFFVTQVVSPFFLYTDPLTNPVSELR